MPDLLIKCPSCSQKITIQNTQVIPYRPHVLKFPCGACTKEFWIRKGWDGSKGIFEVGKVEESS